MQVNDIYMNAFLAATLNFLLLSTWWLPTLRTLLSGDVNDLNMHKMQMKLNGWLVELSSEMAQNLPRLTVTPLHVMRRLSLKKRVRSFSDMEAPSETPDQESPSATDGSMCDEAVSMDLSGCSRGLVLDESDQRSFDLEAPMPVQHRRARDQELQSWRQATMME